MTFAGTDSAMRALVDFLDVTATLIRSQIQAGQLPEQQVVYQREHVYHFEHSFAGKRERQSTFDTETETEWSPPALMRLADGQIFGTPQFAAAMEALRGHCEIAEPQMKSNLSQLAFELLRRRLYDEDSSVRWALAVQFLRDIEGANIWWDVTLALPGVWLEPDSIRLSETASVRAVVKEDVERRIRMDYPSLISRIEAPFPSDPSAVLDFRKRSPDGREVSVAMEQSCTVLSLYRLASVQPIRSRISPDSSLRQAYEGFSIAPFRAAFESLIEEAEVEDFVTFFSTMMELVPKVQGAGDGEPRPLRLAIGRYQESLVNQMTIEARIASAVTCLESLALKGAERQELSHRLGQRVAVLLSFLGLHPVKTYEDMSRAYDVRSTYVHGGQSGEPGDSLKDLCARVLDYTRQALVIFLLCWERLGKDAVVSKTDNAILDTCARHKLQEVLKEVGVDGSRRYFGAFPSQLVRY